MTTVATLTCPACKDIIYSRCSRDFHYCSCGAIAVDGGFIYLKMHYDPIQVKPQDIAHGTLDVSATRMELYDDWNKNTDRYGKVKL